MSEFDIDAFLASLGDEYSDPGPDPFGGGNLIAPDSTEPSFSQVTHFDFQDDGPVTRTRGRMVADDDD